MMKANRNFQGSHPPSGGSVAISCPITTPHVSFLLGLRDSWTEGELAVRLIAGRMTLEYSYHLGSNFATSRFHSLFLQAVSHPNQGLWALRHKLACVEKVKNVSPKYSGFTKSTEVSQALDALIQHVPMLLIYLF